LLAIRKCIHVSSILQGPAPKRARRSAAKGTIQGNSGASTPSATPVPPDGTPENRSAADQPPSTDPRSQATSQSDERHEGGKVTSLPLPIDTVIKTKWKDGEYHLARVVSRRPREGATDEADMEYYMHFINMNRRMDSWVDVSMVDLSWHVHDGIDEKRYTSSFLNSMSSSRAALAGFREHVPSSHIFHLP
jgi:hypothetical protein